MPETRAHQTLSLLLAIQNLGLVAAAALLMIALLVVSRFFDGMVGHVLNTLSLIGICVLFAAAIGIGCLAYLQLRNPNQDSG